MLISNDLRAARHGLCRWPFARRPDLDGRRNRLKQVPQPHDQIRIRGRAFHSPYARNRKRLPICSGRPVARMEEPHVAIEPGKRRQIDEPPRHNRARRLRRFLTDFVQSLQIEIVYPGFAGAEDHHPERHPRGIFGNIRFDIVCLPFGRFHGPGTHVVEERRAVIGAVEPQPHLRLRVRAFHADCRAQPDTAQRISRGGQRLHQVTEDGRRRIRNTGQQSAVCAGSAVFRRYFGLETGVGTRLWHEPSGGHADGVLFEARIGDRNLSGGATGQRECKDKAAHEKIVRYFPGNALHCGT